MFQRLKIRTKIFAAFLSIGIIPILITGIISLNRAGSALTQQAFSQLESIREVKKKHLEAFFDEQKKDIAILMETAANFRQSAYEKMENTQEIKKAQLKDYFN